MEQVVFGRRKVNVPSSWAELNVRQLMTLARLASCNLSPDALKILFALNVLSLRVKKTFDDGSCLMRRGWHSVTLTAEQCASLASRFSWIITVSRDDEGKETQSLFPRFVADPFPRIRGLHGPGDLFDHLTYYQYMFLQYWQQRSAEDMSKADCLLACLWHSRRSFDSSRIERDARRIGRLKDEVRCVMLWYHASCTDALHKRFPRIFSGEGGSSSSNIFEEQMRVVDALAGGDMTKKDLVRNGYLYDALISMDESVRKNEEFEARMKHK